MQKQLLCSDIKGKWKPKKKQSNKISGSKIFLNLNNRKLFRDCLRSDRKHKWWTTILVYSMIYIYILWLWVYLPATKLHDNLFIHYISSQYAIHSNIWLTSCLIRLWSMLKLVVSECILYGVYMCYLFAFVFRIVCKQECR